MTNDIALSPAGDAADKILRQPYARIILPETDGTFRGEIMEFPGCIASGETASETLTALEDVARSWILAALERGQNIPDPIESSNDFSGRLVLRIPKSLHKKAAWIAEREGVSLNTFITTSLSERVGERTYSYTSVVFPVSPAIYAPYFSVPSSWVCSSHSITFFGGATDNNAVALGGLPISGSFSGLSEPILGTHVGTTSDAWSHTHAEVYNIGNTTVVRR
jgi:antitoxin HicB